MLLGLLLIVDGWDNELGDYWYLIVEKFSWYVVWIFISVLNVYNGILVFC